MAHPLEGRGNPLIAILRRYGWSYIGYCVGGTTAGLLARIPQLLPPLILGIALDSIFYDDVAYDLPGVPNAVIPDATMDQFWLTIGILVGAYGLYAVLDWLANRWFGYFVQRLQHDLRTDTYAEVQRREMAYFEDNQTGEIMAILNNDVNNLSRFFQGVVRRSAALAMLAVVAIGYMLLISWELTLIVLVLFVAYPAINYRYANIIEPLHAARRASVGTLNSRLENNIGGVGTIKSFAMEDHERERVAEASEEYYDTSWDVAWERIKMSPQNAVVENTARASVFFIGGYWILVGPTPVLGGTLTAGGLFAFLMYMKQLRNPFRNLTGVVDSYEEGLASADRIAHLVREPKRVPEAADPVELPDIDGSVEYSDVSFTYSNAETPALQDVSFGVSAGQTVGLVGPTGAGKSTVLKLLMRLYDPDEGRIEIDGVDIRDTRLQRLRSAIAYVSQEPFLFPGTVRENVRYGDLEATDEEIESAIELARAHEFVQELPEGPDTEIGERGVKLSGGQRQRLAIARAIVKDPPVVILDEATSHVDNETEVLIQQGIQELAADRTTFAIAHRLSTVRDADVILVFEDGRIVEQGTHEELLDMDGLYARQWGVQIGDRTAGQQLSDRGEAI